MNKERRADERTAKAQRPPAGQSCLPRSRCPDLLQRREMPAPEPSLPGTCARCSPLRGPHPGSSGSAGRTSCPRHWLPGFPTVCLILSPNRAPAATALSGPKWQEASVGETRPFIAVLASWRSPLAALHRRPRVAPLAQPARIPLVDGGLVAGFNGGIIFTQQTPLEVS